MLDFARIWPKILARAARPNNRRPARARRLYNYAQTCLKQAYLQNTPIEHLVLGRGQLVDALLVNLWQGCRCAQAACLVAVGGYGRGNLLPHSDIDLLIIYPEGRLNSYADSFSQFITSAWDIGLKVSHSVRSVQECGEQAEQDISTLTNLLEARHLSGEKELFETVSMAISPAYIWPAEAFFQAKKQEQAERYERFDDTAYQLEPNIKETPGGLRDIHMISWVAKRKFNAQSLGDLARYHFLTTDEVDELKTGRDFLWRVRFGLHTLARRCEDRLLFNYQTDLAHILGYRDQENHLAVEQFMQHYYRHIKRLSMLNDILLQHFEQAILAPDQDQPATPINYAFEQQFGFIQIRHEQVFKEDPAALLDIFYQLQKRPYLSGIEAQTLRHIQTHLEFLDRQNRNHPRCRHIFMKILFYPTGITRTLRRMNRYGVLGQYLPNFGHIIGRMQYDLFHTLTVDEHTLFVVRNLRRLAESRFNDELPKASRIMQAIERPQPLYIAALFHDIAKGRGGDHSILGAVDAKIFCQNHKLGSADTQLICWLVRQHLLMSMTAQRQDIYDPAVIHHFAQEVTTQSRLDQLFLLTICDIRATNPKLWNNWRESLLTELYTLTSRALKRGLDNPIQQSQLIAEKQQQALARLRQANFNGKQIRSLWTRFDDDYFLRHSAQEIELQARAIINHTNLPIITLHIDEDRNCVLFIYTHDRDYLVGMTTGVLARAGLSILDARISTTGDGYTLDTYIISDEANALDDPFRRNEIQTALTKAISDPNPKVFEISRPLPRQLRYFEVEAHIFMANLTADHLTQIEIIAADRPGLLVRISNVFQAFDINIKRAKISTIGERANDIFLVSDKNDHPIARDIELPLRKALLEALEQQT